MPRETLQVLRDNGLRLLLVGYESGNQQILINIKKGLRVDRARRFAADCRNLGITVHGTFILGLPGETQETIQETSPFRQRGQSAHPTQVSVAAPYPGTELLPARRWRTIGCPTTATAPPWSARRGTQLAALSYPHLRHTEILDSVDTFYKRFYFRPRETRRDVGRDGPPAKHGRPEAAGGCRVRSLPGPPRPSARVTVTGSPPGSIRCYRLQPGVAGRRGA